MISTEMRQVGKRIANNRTILKLRQADLAKEAKLTERELKAAEEGVLDIVVIKKIAKALNLSPLALLEEGSSLSEMRLNARNLGKNKDEKILKDLIYLSEVHTLLEDEVQEYKKYKMEEGEKIYDYSVESIKSGLGKMTYAKGDRLDSLIEKVEENLGIDIIIRDGAEEEILGLSAKAGNFCVIYLRRDISARRMLFTLAHELGHLCAPQNSGVHVDIKLADNETELVANTFAAEFLMPEQEIKEYLKDSEVTPGVLHEMLEIYEVSFQALIIRLKKLSFITPSLERSFLEQGTSILKHYREIGSPMPQGPKGLIAKAEIAVKQGFLSEAALIRIKNG